MNAKDPCDKRDIHWIKKKCDGCMRRKESVQQGGGSRRSVGSVFTEQELTVSEEDIDVREYLISKAVNVQEILERELLTKK